MFYLIIFGLIILINLFVLTYLVVSLFERPKRIVNEYTVEYYSIINDDMGVRTMDCVWFNYDDCADSLKRRGFVEIKNDYNCWVKWNKWGTVKIRHFVSPTYIATIKKTVKEFDI